ncbi:MAG: DUF4339 domain-containing protein [Bacteroidota bacterium]|nr:DUF4339 domain-containing protein [Bacteroidota bacterium]
MNAYYLHDGRNELGPFTIDNLRKQKLTRNTPIRLEGKNNWAPAEKISGLKELVAPSKIRRPKDIVPAMVESITGFTQQRPKTAYGILLCVALLAAISIYSVNKKVSKSAATKVLKTPVAIPLQPVVPPALPAVITEKKVVVVENPKVDKEKDARLHWNKLFTAANSSYGIGFLGGIKDLKIIITNLSNYPVEEAVAKITYIKASGGIWKTKLVSIYNVPAHDVKEQMVPDVARGKKVTVRLEKVVSKKLKFSYTVGKKISNPGDPYFAE